MKKQVKKTTQDISRKEALEKIGSYGKYAALTALGTYLILDPQKAQAGSPVTPTPTPPAPPGAGFGSGRGRKRRSNRR